MLTPDRKEFEEQVADAYQHLYDIVCLRTHPLTDLLIPRTSISRKDKAWRLHHILVDVIEELYPGPQAPVFSREWRRHRLMQLRYLDGLDPTTVADELNVSRRHYYREHDSAIAAVASILWDRYMIAATAEQEQDTPAAESATNRLELLRLEAARLKQESHYVRPAQVVRNAVKLLSEMAKQKNVQVHTEVAEELPHVAVEQNILRQLLLGLLSYLVEQLDTGQVRITATFRDKRLKLRLGAHGPRATSLGDEGQMRLTILEELAAMHETEIEFTSDPEGAIGFEITLPTIPPRTILVVDDNEDVLQLFQRYLGQYHFQIVTARSSKEAIERARQLQPDIITLDLMMPEQDGWDALQTLTNQPKTAHIPIVVCSVLSAKELALSLGAAAFLEKPLSEQSLLATLNALDLM